LLKEENDLKEIDKTGPYLEKMRKLKGPANGQGEKG